MEKLISAETLDGGQLRKAATLKGDESILLQIQGKDCVALEVKYHKRCYLKYVSVLRSRKDELDEQSSKAKYQQSFDIFCEQFVKNKVIQDEEIFYRKKIKEEFVKTVAEVENEDASSYNTSRLKQRMQKQFPQLVFQTTQGRSKSEIVYSSDMRPSKIVEDVACGDSSQTSSETDDSESTFGTKKAGMSYATLRELYDVALTLRTELRDMKNAR